MTSHVTAQRDGAVLTVLLDNPPYNFLTGSMMSDLHGIIDGLADDPGVRVVVLTSAVPGVFISHYDVAEILGGVEPLPVKLSPRVAGAALKAVGSAAKVPGARAGLSALGGDGVLDLQQYHEITRLMRSSDKVFIAAINGRALGGGCELALACDFRLMADGPFEIGQPEILVGLIPGGGGTQMLPRTVGTTRALELCLDGRPLTPAEAAEIGLITRVVPADELVAETARLAERLARRSPVAVAAVKRAIHEGGSLPLDKGMRLERTEFIAAASSPSSKRAMAAYLADVSANADAGATMDDFVRERFPAWLDGTAVEF